MLAWVVARRHMGMTVSNFFLQEGYSIESAPGGGGGTADHVVPAQSTGANHPGIGIKPWTHENKVVPHVAMPLSLSPLTVYCSVQHVIAL